METFIAIFAALIISTGFAYASDGLVRDDRGNVVRTDRYECVTTTDADSRVADEACDAATGRTAMTQELPARLRDVPAPGDRSLSTHFDTNRAKINPNDEQRIQDAAQHSGPVRRAVVTGYTDYRGNGQSNQRLATRRAEATKAQLVKNGIPARQIEVQTQAPAASKKASPCADLSGQQLSDCLSSDRKTEVQIQAR